MEMKKVKLGEICDSITDGTHQVPPKTKEGVPFITISDIDSNQRINFDSDVKIAQDFYDNLSETRKAKIGDILYSVVGSFGKAVYITENREFVFQRHIAILRPNEEVNSQYVYYAMSTPKFYSSADLVAIGAAQRTISLNNLRNLEIPLPPCAVQDKIVGILSAYDEMIDNCKQQIALLEEAAQRLYRELISNSEGEPTLMNQIIKLQSGYAFKSASFEAIGKYAIVTIKNVKDGAFDDSKFSFINEVPSKMPTHCHLHTGDIVMSLTGDVARCCFIIGENNLLNQRVARIKSAYPNFAYLFLRSSETHSKLCNLANGAAQQNLSPIRAEYEQFNLPSVRQIGAIDTMTKPYLEKVKALNQMISHLKKCKIILLPRLISGQIEIKA